MLKQLILQTLILVLLTASLSNNSISQELDACHKQIPQSLIIELKREYPLYRLVIVSDYAPETIKYEKQYHEGNECLSIISADFDGNSENDFGVLITDNANNEVLIVARSIKNKWIIEKLMDFNQGRLGTSYVNRIDPGTYEDIWGNGSKPGRVEKISTNKPGIITGTIESSGVAYFYTENKWVHLWLCD